MPPPKEPKLANLQEKGFHNETGSNIQNTIRAPLLFPSKLTNNGVFASGYFQEGNFGVAAEHSTTTYTYPLPDLSGPCGHTRQREQHAFSSTFPYSQVSGQQYWHTNFNTELDRQEFQFQGLSYEHQPQDPVHQVPNRSLLAPTQAQPCHSLPIVSPAERIMSQEPVPELPTERRSSVPAGDNEGGQKAKSSFPGEWLFHQEFVRESSGDSVIDFNSVFDESGRSFSAFREGKYLFPNDAAEQDRLDLQHACFSLLFKRKLIMAPVPETPKCVLDAACGTGIWAVHGGESLFHGGRCDLSAIQPINPPQNCSFVQDDCESEWLYPGISLFDYVHFRMVFSCFNDTTTVIKHAYDNLAPGGWIEFQDSALEFLSIDGSHEGTAMQRYSAEVIKGAAALGRNLLTARHYKDWLVEAGFVDVVEKKLMWPCNAWPDERRLKAVGLYNSRNITDGIRGVGWKLLRAAGLEPQEIEDLILQFKKQLANPQYRTYLNCYVVYGRKPFNGETSVYSRPKSETEGFPPG
ncbi:hypothetical protein JX266_011743 [Neoarthrinium moseri]|nr:hypothetical protein JX266_011743 [Neoarthrinium moseri]